MRLRAFVTHYVVVDGSSPFTVYDVWIYDLTDPDHPRKLPYRLGKYTMLYRAESAKLRFDAHRVEIELKHERAALEYHYKQDAQV